MHFFPGWILQSKMEYGQKKVYFTYEIDVDPAQDIVYKRHIDHDNMK